MQTLFDSAVRDEVKARLGKLSASSGPLWGTMTAAQAMAHCSISMQMALGDSKPPRVLIGYVFGRLSRGIATNDAPMQKNAPTAPSMVVADERDLTAETAKLGGLVDRFSLGGPAGCTQHPHPFFGKLTPNEWGMFMYKHLDHHLKQFGV